MNLIAPSIYLIADLESVFKRSPAGATRRKIILPQEVWHDFWSTQTYEGGGEIDYAAPLDRLPLLVRGGSIIPMGPVLQHIPDGHRFDKLQLHIWPPYPASGVLYDDDGRTRAYQRGEYSVTRFVAEENSRRTVVRVEPAEGNFPGGVGIRELEIVLHRAEAPAEVKVNGGAVEDWRYEAEGRRVVVGVRCEVREGVRVEVLYN